MASPMHHHSRSTSSGLSNMRRPQNTKAAAQRLAQVMAHQPADEEEEEDDLLYDFSSGIPSAGIGLAGGRQIRNRSPLSVRNSVEQLPSARPISASRASAVDQQPLSARSGSLLRPIRPKPVERSPSPHSSTASRLSQPVNYADEAQPPSARSNASGRSPTCMSSADQPLSARFTSLGRPNLRIKTVPTVPAIVPLSLKPVASGVPADPSSDKNKDKRLSLDFGTFKHKESGGQQSSSALQDELDMLQEENDNLLEKLRIAEERCEEAESRTRQLEKQIASLGEGVSLEARLLSRKEADLQKREVALKVAAETYGGSSEEIAALRTEIETARDEATSALEQLHDVEEEVNSLRTVTQRMILTQQELEEVVLKRCWLARCWSLCVRHGIHAEIAGARHEFWSYFASQPVEVILAAGRKAKENSSINNDLEERESVLQNIDEVSKKANVESVLMVEKGLKELSALKVEEAIAISMAQKRLPNIVKSNVTDELKLPTESNDFSEAFELSAEESEDVLLKQAWLRYFWRRAKNQGLEPDIAEERLEFWINQGDRPPTSHDAVDAERGMLELRKLGIDTKLWEESRRLVDPDNVQKTLMEIELQILS